MIGKAPEYTQSKYFVSEPMWHLTEDAPEKLKRQFELDMNNPDYMRIIKLSYPEMKNPFYTWEGKIVDRKK